MTVDSIIHSGMDTTDNDFFKSVMESIRDSIKIIDRRYNVIYANKAQYENADVPIPSELDKLGKCFDEFFHSQERCSYCVIEKVFESGSPAFNVFQEYAGKELRIKELSAFPLTNSEGAVQYVIEFIRDVTLLKNDLIKSEEFSEIISQDASMHDVFEGIKSVAAANSTVLINGDTGTGKELVARAIYQNSGRMDKRLVTINCGALTETLLETELFGHEKGAFTGAEQKRIGKFELAHNGTLFLDEIGTISQAMQVKILRALQEGEITRVGGNDPIKVNVRIICATNLDLAEAVRNGTFREDLFYRINVVPLRLPPLRERGDDVQLLAEHYLEKFSREIGKDLRGFTEGALNQMRRYSWPGNVRELRNLVERAVILSRGQSVEQIDIPPPDERTNQDEIMSSLTMKEVVKEAERKYLVEVLKSNNGNISDTAKSAGVNARTIHRKMCDFSLTKENFK